MRMDIEGVFVTNYEMVDALKAEGAIRSSAVEAAFRKVDRAFFVNDPGEAYFDTALPTLVGQTISSPTVVATMLEWLDVHPGMNVLEVGSGSGYNAALISELAGKNGQVVTIEKYPELSRFAKENVAKAKVGGNIFYEIGDGSAGCPRYAPYDRIIVTAAMPGFGWDHPLGGQLKQGGKLVAPIGDTFMQQLIVYDRRTGSGMAVLGVMFVPLVGKYAFSE